MTAALICAALALIALCFVVYFAIDDLIARRSELKAGKASANMIEPPDFLREKP